MARIVWSEVGGVAEAIVNGEHDGDLELIQLACKSRMKRMFRVRQRVRLKGTSNVTLEGAEGVIEKVNEKSISVFVEGHGSYRVPARMLEVV